MTTANCFLVLATLVTFLLCDYSFKKYSKCIVKGIFLILLKLLLLDNHFSCLKVCCVTHLLIIIYADSFVIAIESVKENVSKTFNGCQLTSTLLVESSSRLLRRLILV